jgi:hypothetical protein
MLISTLNLVITQKVGLFDASISVTRVFKLTLALSLDFESGGSNINEKDFSEFHID